MKLPLVVTTQQAKEYRAQMSKPDLVFLTEHNQEIIKDAVEEKVVEQKIEDKSKILLTDAL